MMNDLVGKSYVFEDGNSIKVTQVKLRDGNIPWVTYETVIGPNLPRKYVITITEFIEHYGHLFKINSDDIPGNLHD